MGKLGARVYGLAAMALGVIGLAWDDFAAVWQPVPAHLPERGLLAYAVAAVLVLGGSAINWRRTAAAGAAILTVLYLLGVVLLHAPIVAAKPLELESWAGAAEQLALVAGGLIAYAAAARISPKASGRITRTGQILFAVCLFVFGAVHFVYLDATSAAVPKYLPLGPYFWARFTGAAHIAAGLAIAFNVRARLAAILLTAMFIGFSALVHIPALIAGPASHFNWTINAINLALIGAAWTMADSLARKRG